ncbi:MAG: adenylyl-sulfate kinase [Mycobacteriales bacterium]
MTSSAPRAVVLNGSVGAGKTTIAYAIGDLLDAKGIPGAMIDLDALRSGWPAPDGDRFNTRIMHRNLASVVANYRGEGMSTLVLPGVVETVAERTAYTESLGGIVPILVRLAAPAVTLQERVRRRAATEGERAWHAARAVELTAILDAADVDDHIVANDGGSPEDVAAEVLRVIGWTDAL